MKWISVEEQRPHPNTDVLCYMKDGTMIVGYIHGIYCMWYANIDEGCCEEMDADPIYWMPLPEPPTTEDCDEL